MLHVECLSVTAVDHGRIKEGTKSLKSLSREREREGETIKTSGFSKTRLSFSFFLPFDNLFVCCVCYLQFSGFEDSEKEDGQGGTETRKGHVEDAEG